MGICSIPISFSYTSNIIIHHPDIHHLLMTQNFLYLLNYYRIQMELIAIVIATCRISRTLLLFDAAAACSASFFLAAASSAAFCSAAACSAAACAAASSAAFCSLRRCLCCCFFWRLSVCRLLHCQFRLLSNQSVL